MSDEDLSFLDEPDDWDDEDLIRADLMRDGEGVIKLDEVAIEGNVPGREPEPSFKVPAWMTNAAKAMYLPGQLSTLWDAGKALVSGDPSNAPRMDTEPTKIEPLATARALSPWSDEVGAGLRTAWDGKGGHDSIGDAYSANLRVARHMKDEDEAMAPSSVTLGEHAGALTTMAMPVGSAATGVAGLAKTGAAFGAMDGAGRADGGMGDAALYGAGGGLLGGALGALGGVGRIRGGAVADKLDDFGNVQAGKVLARDAGKQAKLEALREIGKTGHVPKGFAGAPAPDKLPTLYQTARAVASDKAQRLAGPASHKVASALRRSPASLGKFQGILEQASSRGGVNAATLLLSKNSPGFRQMMTSETAPAANEVGAEPSFDDLDVTLDQLEDW